MNFHIMTLFPDMVEQGLKTSIIGRAEAKGLLSIDAVNIRDYAFNKHQSVDDYPYGGGAGMLMQAEPVFQCYEAVCQKTKASKEGKRPSLSTCLHRAGPLTRKWRKNSRKRMN